jgi:glycosyltransferase involved in cell wall biosynthesis
MERQQERTLLAECAACVFAFRYSEIYDPAFPQWSEKFFYIPNGYDSTDFDGVEPKRFDKLTIVHNGTFLPGYRTPATFLQALRRLLSEETDLAARLEVLFVGKAGQEGSLIRELSLDSVVRQAGYVPHRECVAYLKGADLLLLVGGSNRTEETGKVYEYMATGKPILAVIRPDGAAAKVLANYGPVRVIDRQNVNEIAEALRALVLDRGGFRSAVNSQWVSRFERWRLTGRLAEVFDHVSSSSS